MALDLDAVRLVDAIRKLSERRSRPDTMTFRTVACIDPLKVDIGNNIVIDDRHIFLCQMCRPHRGTVPHTHLIDAYMTEATKSVNTTAISAGTATNVPQNTTSYDEGTNERELKTETKTNVDLGGATFTMKIDVTGSTTAGAVASGGLPTAGAVTPTTDLSTFGVTDDAHQHIVTEKVTQDVHFPGTDYEDSVEIEIYPRLKVGDKVLLFAFNDHQMFYFAERIEEV